MLPTSFSLFFCSKLVGDFVCDKIDVMEFGLITSTHFGLRLKVPDDRRLYMVNWLYERGGVRNCEVLQMLSRFKYGSLHPDGLLILDDAVSWRWAVLVPWFIYGAVCLLLYIVGDGAAAGLLAFCAAATFVTIVATNGHRLSSDNRSVHTPHTELGALIKIKPPIGSFLLSE